MTEYRIKDDLTLHLFPMAVLCKLLHYTHQGIRQKEHRGMVPPARFRDSAGNRMYSLEEIAMYEYLFKEIWKGARGKPIPDWMNKLSYQVIDVVQRYVIKNGSIEDESVFAGIKHPKFSKWMAMVYIEHWREILLDEKTHDYDLD